ncbi:MAG TPA: helix-turn-helix domain-containing protein [Trebonia sp.]|nr:helix-turn-helix domain-containing protein [Trebonia sp.]
MSCDSNLAKDAEGEPPEQPPVRRDLRDPRAMRAMTHPVRLALIEALSLEGPLTATQAGELIGEPPNTCSFHLRQLAKYGFVEEAGPAPGRSRPWRLVSTSGMHFTDLHEDPSTAIAARELDAMLRERYLARLDAFYATRSSLPREWQEVTGGSQLALYLTPAELRQVDEEIMAILGRYLDRLADPECRPAGAEPVEVLLFAFPFRQPGR